jgi:hypothetical protein
MANERRHFRLFHATRLTMHDRAHTYAPQTATEALPAAGTREQVEQRDIIKDGVILARHIVPGDFRQGLAFYSHDEEFLQVGTWRYNCGQQLRAHSHNIVPREVNRTNEVVVVLQGAMAARIFDEQREFVETVTVREGELLLLMNGGHDYTILEDNTRILEIKNGPFLGRDIDKTLF